jgi:hypothetical protein
MKLLLLLLSVVAAQAVVAQTDFNELLRKTTGEWNRLHPAAPDMPNSFRYKPLYRGELLGTTISPRPAPGVHRLPQDGMPCVVPVTENIALIPNASPVVRLPFRSKMPNAFNGKPPVDATK